uniref:BTB domain-containing protein n=1 Tax=Panagrolaimus sp. JU765 TaxID=591449 RepID=A0AC34PWY6_9BILA
MVIKIIKTSVVHVPADSIDCFCPKPVKIKWKCTVEHITDKLSHIFSNNLSNGFDQFGRKNQLVVDGFMKIESVLKFTFDDKMVQELEKPIPLTVALLDDDKFKDFTIQVENKEIMVHKNIIAVASPVFSAMLEPHTKEFKEGRVTIEDFDYETVKAGVDLIYTQKLNNDLPIKKLLDLYKFVDKYDLADKEQFFIKFDNKIDLKTVLEISKFSKTNSMDELYKKCVEWFADNFEDNVDDMDDFKQLDPQFVMDVKAFKS